MRRRQKKVLSLVLCVAMMLSVMVVGAGAAFSDQSKIKNTEAVDACTALNIIGGYPDGSFKPEGNITRAEVTKMICVALNGGKEPNLATNATPTFSDVRTNANSAWAEKYIESCYAQGIVSGVGGGKFAPAGNVTGTQLAKMLLVSLGYNPDIEKFTGNAWATNVNIIATQKGLYEGLENIDVSAALTRDNAAQMIWNALKAGEVKYEYTLVSENGTLVSKTTLVDKKDTNGKDLTLLKDKYNVAIVEEGIVTNVEKDDKGTYNLTTTAGSYKKITKDYSDLMGQKVDVLVKDNDNSKIFGVYANEDSSVIATGVVGDLDVVTGTNEKIKVDSKEYKIESASVYNFNHDQSTGSLLALAQAQKNGTNGVKQAYSIKLIDNDNNGKIDRAVVTPFAVAEITYVGTNSITMNVIDGTAAIGNKNTDDVDAYNGIAKDDYAVVYRSDDTVSGNYATQKLDKITGKVTATKDNGAKGQIDGTWYTSVVRGETFTLNDTVDVYAVAGYAFKVEVSENGATSADALFVDEIEVKTGLNAGLNAKLYFTDGTSTEAAISKIDDVKLLNGTNDVAKAGECKVVKTDNVTGTFGAANSVINEAGLKTKLEGKLFTYTKDGSKYEIKALSTNNKCGYKGYADLNTTNSYNDKYLNYAKLNGTDSEGSMKIADDAIFFVKGSDDTKVLSGKQINAWGDVTVKTTATSQVMYSESNGFKYAKVGALVIAGNTDNDIPDASGDIVYGYLLDDMATIQEGNTKYYSLKVWTENGEKTFKAKTGEVKGTAPAKGDFIKYNIGDGTLISDISKYETYGAVTAYAEGSTDINLTANTGSSVPSTFKNKLADTAKIIYVNTKDTKGVEGGKIAVAQKDTVNYIANVVYVIPTTGDDANKITWLFVDTNNDLEDVPNPEDSANDTAVTNAVNALKAKMSASTAAADGQAAATAWTANPVTLTADAKSADVISSLTMTGVTTSVSVEGSSTMKAEYKDSKITVSNKDNSNLSAGPIVLKVTVSAGAYSATRYVSVELTAAP